MKKRFILFTVLMIGAGFASAQAPDLGKLDLVERSVPAGPAALVNGVPIEGSYFLEEYRQNLRSVIAMAGEKEVTDELRVHTALTTLRGLLHEEILIQEAARRNLKVDAKAVEKEYQEKLSAFMEFVEQGSGEKVTETQVLERAGQSREEALESVRRQLLAERTVEELGKASQVSVTDQEVRKFYDDNPHIFEMPGSMHLNQILVEPKPNAMKADEKAWTKAREQILHAKSRIEAGEQFAAVARSISEAPDKDKGGDLGMMPVDMLPPFFREAGQAMKPRELSDPIRSEYGMHLIQLVGTESQHSISFEEARDQIRDRMKEAKMEEAALEFCEPIINDPERTQIFLQLERSLAALSKED